ncbi:uncharacterized protein DDB_G0290685-like [Bradysia coprophila]|uniref:uncharacterized protein DDB_G0290685-like n=1 Tax=Bradysia coprophila TaxID=38358 RepID=UPI00187D8A53|nr:uncharacterized protein DDB_G0290685-like [Bradysia coprophila]
MSKLVDSSTIRVERKKSPHGFDKSFKKTTKKRPRIFESDEDTTLKKLKTEKRGSNGSATVYDEDIELRETQKRQANGVSLKNPKCEKRLANNSATETDRDVRASSKKPETKKHRVNDSATESDEDSLKKRKADKRQIINYDNASLDCPFCKCSSTPQPKSSKKHGVFLDINNFKRHLLGMHNITSLSIAADKQANDGDSKALKQPTTNATEKEGKLANGKNQTDKKFNVGDGIASLQSAADRVKNKKRKSSSLNDQDSATDRNGSGSDVDAPMEQPAADQAQNENGMSIAPDKQANDGDSKALEQPITSATEKEGKLTNGKNQTDKKFNVGDDIASLQSAADRVKKKKRKSSSSNGTTENVGDGEATTEEPSTDLEKNKKWSASPNDLDSATDRNGSDSDVDAPMEQPAADQAQEDNGRCNGFIGSLSNAADKQANDGDSKALQQSVMNATVKEGKSTNGTAATKNVGDDEGEPTTDQSTTDPEKYTKSSTSPNDLDGATDRNGSDCDVDEPMEQPAADQAQKDNGTADEDFLSGPEIESSSDEDDFIEGEESEDSSENSSEDEFKDAESISEKSEERVRRKRSLNRHVPKRQFTRATKQTGGTVKKTGGTVKKTGRTVKKTGRTVKKTGGTVKKTGRTVKKTGGTMKKTGGTRA